MNRKFRNLSLALLALLVAGVFAASSLYAVEVKDNEQYFPVLTYKTGPFAPGGSGIAGGLEDYFTLLNLRDGGLNGVKIVFEECDFGYNTDRGVECYERVKNKGKYGAPVINPNSTGVAYALIERATRDKIPIVTLGYGRSDSTDGTIFPYVFPLMTNYWSQNAAKIRYIAQVAGGEKNLKGMRIVNLHLKHPYGQETIPILNALSKKFGFKVTHLPVPWPGIDQKSLWLQIKRIKPDWVINRNWGVSCTVPLREAARIGFPRNRILGVWWCGSEEDVIPAGKAAIGYVTTNFHGVGTDYPVIQDIFSIVYGQMKGNIAPSRVGSVYYHRGLVFGIVMTEAMLTAQKQFGNRPLGGKEMQWGLERLDITEARIAELGATGLVSPLKTTWKNHEGVGGGKIVIQQWDGKKWNRVSDWIPSYADFVSEFVKESAAKYAKAKGIKRRMSADEGI
ncbi:MAG: ABC transporter substrate-binding protein [SAR324 cluster bacterium]|nr:ABC transporter substrate-binding protein [SAR324 cluster bacterium]